MHIVSKSLVSNGKTTWCDGSILTGLHKEELYYLCNTLDNIKNLK